MPAIHALKRLLADAETKVDDLKYGLKRHLGYTDPVTVQPYRGYGDTHTVRLFARVLEDEGLRAPAPGDSTWTNLVRMTKMLETDEVPAATVIVRFAGQEKTVTADEEGYISVAFDARDGSPGGRFAPGRQEVVYTLHKPQAAEQEGYTTVRGEAYIPRPDADFIVVSDVDDTVMHTGATSLMSMAVNTLFTNAYGRVAFPGVAAFYRALHAADAGGSDGRNPLFYLTSSLWNIYDLMRVFFDVNGLPSGPILMRDLGISRTQFIHGSHEEHKLGRVRELMDLYPRHPFVLIGDTGQKDAEIYRQAVREHAGRVAAVYLRDVSGPGRDQEVRRIVQDIRDLGVGCVAAEDSVAHAEHAASIKLIPASAVDAVRGGSDDDRAAGVE